MPLLIFLQQLISPLEHVSDYYYFLRGVMLCQIIFIFCLYFLTAYFLWETEAQGSEMSCPRWNRVSSLDFLDSKDCDSFHVILFIHPKSECEMWFFDSRTWTPSTSLNTHTFYHWIQFEARMAVIIIYISFRLGGITLPASNFYW